MRGRLDLSGHKLAGLYRPPAKKTRWRSKGSRYQKMPADTYHTLWRLVDGACRDAFNKHPDYLTDKGRRDAAVSITKRVTGALYGYAAQAAQSRSRTVVEFTPELAAETTAPLNVVGRWTRFSSSIASWANRVMAFARGGIPHAARNSTEKRDG